MRKILLIINPAAGRRLGEQLAEELTQKLRSRGDEVVMIETGGPGWATMLAQSSIGQFDILVCCGGDGTLHETMQALVDVENAPKLGYIPMGTTNDFATTLKLETDPEKAIEAILDDAHEYLLDVGQFENRYFSYVAAFGAFTQSSYLTSQALKNHIGYSAYLANGAMDVLKIHKAHMKIQWDDDMLEDDFIYGSISNSSSIAKIVHLTEDQMHVDDGELELLLIRFPKDMDELTRVINILTHNDFTDDLVIFRHVKHAVFASPTPLAWTLDGENGGEITRSHVQIHPHGIRLIH